MLINSLQDDNNLTSLWENCLSDIKNSVGDSAYNTWFAKSDFIEGKNGIHTVRFCNEFAADLVEANFDELVKDIISKNGLNCRNVRYISKPQVKEWKIKHPKSIHTGHGKLKSKAKAKLPPELVSYSNFSERYTFSNFIVGDENRVAQTASLATAEAPGKTSFNPLFIYGNTGVGKTHLLQAIGNFAQKEKSADNIVYLSSKDFINMYMKHISNSKESATFYKKFSNIDILLLDDFHFLKKKMATQREFLKIFNNLLMLNKQIVITSDRKPDEIEDIMSELVNRFTSGLTVCINPPNFETRMEILRNKAKIDKTPLPADVVEYIASKVTSNVRELEGTLVKLIASSSFTGTPITLSATQEIFNDVVSRKGKSITTEAIQNIVAEHFGVSSNQLRAHVRKKNITQVRNIAMYLARKLTKQSYRTIGLDFGGRDYSTITCACRKIQNEIEATPDFSTKLCNLEAEIFSKLRK